MIAGIAGIVSAVSKGLDGLLTSDEERLKAERDIATQIDKPFADQREVNKIEAGHRSIWVAGWRPAIGWTCAAGLAYHFVFRPLIGWAFQVVAVFAGVTIPAPPPVDTETLMTLVLSLLGLGGLRTYEKMKGLSK